MHRAAHAGDNRFGLEHVELVLPCAEADSADTLVAVHERIHDEHSLNDLAASGRDRVLRCLGDDDLVGLAVDHELPPAFMDVLACLVFPDLESPLLEEVDCGIHVTGNVVHQVFPGDTHEVAADIADVILRRVLAVFDAYILVNGRKTHGHGPASVQSGLVDQCDLEAFLLGPIGRFCSGATS